MSALDHPRDQYTGIGGRYVRDPETGERRPADEPTRDDLEPPQADEQE